MERTELMHEQGAWIAHMDIRDRYLVGQTSRLLRVVESQIYRLIRYKGLPAVKIVAPSRNPKGGLVRIPHDGLVEWMSEDPKPYHATLLDDEWVIIVPVKEHYPTLDVARILRITASQVYAKIRHNTLAHIEIQPLAYRRAYFAVVHDEVVRYLAWAKENTDPTLEVEVEPYDGF